MTKDWRVQGLGWAWGAWCGAGAVCAPDPALIPIALTGWWLFRHQAPMLLPFWFLLAVCSGLWWQVQPPVLWDQAICELTEVQQEGRLHRGRGQIALSAWHNAPISVRSAPSVPGFYSVQRHDDKLEWTFLEPLSSWRKDWKDRWRLLLQQAMQSRRASELYAAMATGEVEENTLRALLGRFGMSHLLALSGLHVTLVMQSVGRLLRSIGLFGQSLLLAQSVTLLAYLLGVGPYASALRAGGMALFALIGLAIGRRCSAEQTLGLTMTLLLVWDPSLCMALGFQLSCGATFGLIIWSRPLAGLLQRCLIREEARATRVARLLSVIIEAAACNLAVLPLTVPVLLWRFHEINLLGLWINGLFAPLLAWGFSISMFVPLFSKWLGIPLAIVTEWILELLEMPWWWDLWTPPCEITTTGCLCLTWLSGLAAMLVRHRGDSSSPAGIIHNVLAFYRWRMPSS